MTIFKLKSKVKGHYAKVCRCKKILFSESFGPIKYTTKFLDFHFDGEATAIILRPTPRPFPFFGRPTMEEMFI
jgi:hypothetical protein